MLLSAYGEGADVIKASRLFRSFEERLPPGLGVDAGARRGAEPGRNERVRLFVRR
ncbi:hypothetical protein BMONG18_0667 [Bifidobacterium mongoliense]|jgi:hypothetical protein|uniref:Uncharacterized protein n=1 Tax=Bifidobacterium mongoliense TaxID=518643 RepID=A0A423UEC8_9BIFI|nr:hypothetical protein BMONG18_0667 [Bifidobacterium mongoliense]